MNDSIFDTLIKRLQTLPMEGIVERAVDRQDNTIIDLNIEQLSAGIRADGSKIDPPYRPRTLIIKAKKGQRTDVVTLQDTKDFVHAIRIRNFTRQKELYSQDEKSEDLQNKYKPEIFGLTNKNLSIIRRNMLPLMRKDVRNLVRNFRSSL